MYKNIIKNILKFSMAAGLIYWLVQSGKLDFNLIGELLNKPLSIAITLFILQFDNFLVALRLRILLHQKIKDKLSLLRLFIANWIGLFFNSVLPGSVTGDLVKIFYIQDIDKNLTKKFLLISVLIDRVVGLMGLVIVGGISSLLNYQKLVNLSSDVKNLTNINLVLLLGVIVCLSFLFFFPKIPLILSSKLKFNALFTKIFNKCDEIWQDLCVFKNKIIILIITSMLIQGLAIFAFWYLVAPFSTGQSLHLSTVFSVMPTAFITMAIPIAPAGLGVGHVIFQNLLGYFGVTNGASLFNIYFFVLMFSNLTGVLPYILHPGKKPKT